MLFRSGGPRPNSGGARPGAGRKKQEHLATFRELVEAVVTPEDFAVMLRAIVVKAQEGDARAFAQIMDRFYGKATEHVISETVGEQKIKVIYVDVKPNEAKENKDE